MLPRVSLCKHDLESIELCHKEWGSQMLCVSRDVTIHRSGNTTISGILTISQSPSRVSLNLLHAYKGRPAACLWIMPIRPEIKFQRPNMVQIDFQSIETGESCSLLFTSEGFSSLFHSQLEKIQNQQKPARAQLQKKRLFGGFFQTKKASKETEQQLVETEKGVDTAKFYPDLHKSQENEPEQVTCAHVQAPEAPPRKDSFGRPEILNPKPTPPPRFGSLPTQQMNQERGRPQLPKENKTTQPLPSKYDIVPVQPPDALMKEVWDGLRKGNKISLDTPVPKPIQKDPYQEERTHLAEEHDKLVVIRQEKGRRYQSPGGEGNVRKQVLTLQDDTFKRNEDIFDFRKNLRKTPNSSIILPNADRPSLLRVEVNASPAHFDASPAPSSISYIPSVNLKQDPDSITPTQDDYSTPAPSSVQYQESEMSLGGILDIRDESFHSCRSEPSTITGSRSIDDGVPKLRSKISGATERFHKSASCVPSMSSMGPIPSIQASEISNDTVTERSLPENPKTDSGNESISGSSKSINNRLKPLDLRPKRSASMLSVNSFMDDMEVFYPSDIIHRRLLDSGGQANVFLASAKKFPQVAVKYFTCKDANDEQRVKEVVHTMRTSSHPHIVSIHGLVYNSPAQRELRKAPVGYLMEYVKSGSLHNLIYDHSNSYTTIDILDWIRQAASALDHLHKRRIVHRDIKPQNMLWIDSTRTLKICDLGLSASVDSIHTCELGTVYYMAPEVIESANYNELCDIYSLGITIWEMVHRRKPFFDISIGQMSFISRVKNDADFRPSIDQKTDDLLKYLMQWCWKHSPSARPNMDEVHDLVHGRLEEQGFYDDM